MSDTPMDSRLVEAKTAEATAKAQLATAEAKKAVAEAQEAAVAAERAAIDLDRERTKRAKELAADDYARVYRFTNAVNDETTKVCMSRLSEWHRLDGDPAPGATKPYTIVFSSPGGSVIHGMALFDHIRFIQSKGHPIVTVSLGYAASMAGILLQVGDRRIMAKESWLLIHQGSAGAMGSMGEIEDTVNWYKRIDERILDIFYERSHAAKPERPLSRTKIKQNYERKDWWLSSDEALRHGFCDEVQ